MTNNILVQTFGKQKRWVNYRLQTVDGKITKVPYAVTGVRASTTDPSTWSTYEDVLRVNDKVGIVFTHDQQLLGIDIDHCLKEGVIVHEDKDIIIAFIREADTYTEVSPSGEGLHIFLIITESLPLLAHKKAPFECYTSGRYFTVTGASYGRPCPVRTVTKEEAYRLLAIIGYPWGKTVQKYGRQPTISSSVNDSVLLDKMFASKNGTKIKALYDGDTTGHNKDDSSADMALCSHLAFWTAKNVDQMERMWLASPLGSRNKTRERKDYRDRTISACIKICEEVLKITKYQGRNPLADEDGPGRYQALLDAVPKDTPKENILLALQPLLEALAAGKDLADAEIYIRNKVKAELKINTDDTNSILKHFKKMRIEIVAKNEVVKKEIDQVNAEPPLTEREAQAAEDILKSPTLFYDILMMVKKLGVVGEEKNILLHYIILTSRKLKQPLSATVKGDSSSGKSYTLLTTIKMFPKSAYIDLTDATPQSFYYCPEDHFKHKIIVIFEKHGGERADYAIRTLQSEGKLKIQVTVKNPETGQFEARTIEKDGPTGFVTTTTASFIHAENDTRNISMFPDQSSEQTSRVYESVDSRYLGIQPVSEAELKLWHHAQLTLEQLPIHIPFVKSFRKYFPKNIIRTRRDYGHFLAIVETVAFLHQKQRERIELHGQNYIRAILADAYMAKVIVEDSLSKSIYELPEKTIEVIQSARALVKDHRDDSSADANEVKFTITQLAKRLQWDRDTVSKWMKPAGKKGYITVVVESKGSKGAEYKLEEKELPSDTFLPTVEQLATDNPQEKTNGIYDPLTGEAKLVSTNFNTVCTDAPMRVEAG